MGIRRTRLQRGALEAIQLKIIENETVTSQSCNSQRGADFGGNFWERRRKWEWEADVVTRGTGRGERGERKKELCDQGKNSRGREGGKVPRHVQVSSKGSQQTLVGLLLEQQSRSENSG